jgi:hypothetical protein
MLVYELAVRLIYPYSDSSVRLAATKALLNSIDFIKSNFDREAERNYIMQVRVKASRGGAMDLRCHGPFHVH